MCPLTHAHQSPTRFALLRSLAQEAGTEDPAAAWAFRTLAWAVAARCSAFSLRPDPALQFLWEALFFKVRTAATEAHRHRPGSADSLLSLPPYGPQARAAAAAHVAHRAGVQGRVPLHGEDGGRRQEAMVLGALDVAGLQDHAVRVGLAPRALADAQLQGKDVTEQLWGQLMATVRCTECHWVSVRGAGRCPLCRRPRDDEGDGGGDSGPHPRAPPRHNILHLYHTLAAATLREVLRGSAPAALPGAGPGAVEKTGAQLQDAPGAGSAEATPPPPVPSTVAGLAGCAAPLAVVDHTAARSANAEECLHTAWVASPLPEGQHPLAARGKYPNWPGWELLAETDHSTWKPLWSASRLAWGDTVLLAWRHRPGVADAVAESNGDPICASVHLIGASFVGRQDVPMVTLATDLPAGHGACVFRVPVLCDIPRGLSPAWLQLCLKRKGSDHIARTLSTDDAASLTLQSASLQLRLHGDRTFRIGESKTIQWELQGCHPPLVGPLRLSLRVRVPNLPPRRPFSYREVMLADKIEASGGECRVTVTPGMARELGITLDALTAPPVRDGSMASIVNPESSPGPMNMSLYGTLVLHSIRYPHLTRRIDHCRITDTPVLAFSSLAHITQEQAMRDMVEFVDLPSGGFLLVQLAFSEQASAWRVQVVAELRQLQALNGTALQRCGGRHPLVLPLFPSQPIALTPHTWLAGYLVRQ